MSHHQNIRGFGQVAGRRSDDGSRSDVDLSIFADGGPHVLFADEVHGFGRVGGAGDLVACQPLAWSIKPGRRSPGPGSRIRQSTEA
jgi:hypothetical protein